MPIYKDIKGRRVVVKDTTFEGVDFYIAEDRVVERDTKPKLREPEERISQAVADRVNQIRLDD